MFKSHLLKSILLGSLLVSSIAGAATSDTVILGGSVSSSLAIVATDTVAASSLVLTVGQKIVLVADVAITTNNAEGVTMTATSGSLATVAGNTSIAFQVTTVADAATAPIAAGFSVDSGEEYSVSNAAAGDFPLDLYIMYTPVALQDPGAYAGDIFLSVSDN